MFRLLKEWLEITTAVWGNKIDLKFQIRKICVMDGTYNYANEYYFGRFLKSLEEYSLGIFSIEEKEALPK